LTPYPPAGCAGTPARTGAHRRPARRYRLAVALAILLVARGARGCATPAATNTTVGRTPAAIATTPVNGHVTGTAPSRCQERTATDGRPLPDPTCTPGVANSAVTQTTIAQTICRPGYTATIRPPARETEQLKRKLMAAYHEPGALGDYELDHLISLELGGSNDAANLWPERNDHPRAGVINSKDLVENVLHAAVCSGRVTLTQAQQAIATDWTTASARLGIDP
jgi:hypothetical protein